MFIKKIVIEGADGDVEIRRTEYGALVSIDGAEDEVHSSDSQEARYEVARNAAKMLCGTTKAGEPNATPSMILDVLSEIERVAGC